MTHESTLWAAIRVSWVCSPVHTNIPTVCWLDTLSIWQKWCSVWPRQIPRVYFLLIPLKYSRDLKGLVIFNYLLLDCFFPFVYISLTFNYCAGSCGVFFLSMVHCWPLRFSYVFDQLQSNNKWRCKFVVYIYMYIFLNRYEEVFLNSDMSASFCEYLSRKEEK